MITPTVGRIVWCFRRDVGSEPAAAIVTHVETDTMINVAVFGHHSGIEFLNLIPLVQDVEVPAGLQAWCEWMPFQKGQAAKAEALEKQLGAGGLK